MNCAATFRFTAFPIYRNDETLLPNPMIIKDYKKFLIVNIHEKLYLNSSQTNERLWIH